MYVCSCFGVTEQQVREHAAAGAGTPREIASQCKAGTDCGSCVRRIQGLLGRGSCPRREQAAIQAAMRTVPPLTSLTPVAPAAVAPAVSPA
ncbi:(2Fe-2S)-binding protein [Streptomyces sp. SBT349]|uniref:(2Fe-2S)-binding protein n=1 Tax=Streptomyces sp. SBT349 TaxID=1580539 RepID=UPI00066E27F6|nr:(2Fe-2S)-binding protein [Streptomyces sp. SBT349]